MMRLQDDRAVAILPTDAPGMRPSVVADRLGWTTQRAVAALRRAEQAGEVERAPHTIIVRLNRFGSPVYRDAVGYIRREREED